MNKDEAAKYLGCSTRAVERYASAGRLRGRYERGKTGKVLVFNEADVEAFKRELEAPQDKPVEARQEPPEGPTRQATTATLARRVEAPQLARNADLAGFVAALMEAAQSSDKGRQSAPVEAKLLLTLAEAQQLTGLSRGILREAIDAKKLKAQQIGRAWRIKRSDLDAYIAKL
jgi:excisionase family DNA binding protein